MDVAMDLKHCAELIMLAVVVEGAGGAGGGEDVCAGHAARASYPRRHTGITSPTTEQPECLVVSSAVCTR